MLTRQAPARRAAALLIIAAIAAWAAGTAPRQARAAVETNAEPAFRAGELVVSIEPASGLSVDALSAELGASVRAELAPGSGTYLLRTPPGADVPALAARLELDPRLDFAEPNYRAEAPEANPRGIGGWGGTDPAPLPGQPALAQIRLAEASQLSSGAGVTVAIIDTGAELGHPALAGSLAPGGYDFVDGDALPEDVPNGLDDDGDGVADEAYGHGTHVAGIVHTVAPGARLLVIRALTAEGAGDTFTVARAIRYAAAQGAAVINLSLGTPAGASVLREAVVAAAQSGAVVAAAAGNDATGEKQFPAAGNCAIAVTAVGPADRRSSFANFGGWVSVAAPGELIFSALPPGGYGWWSGTSMATPFVAGQAALLRSMRPGLDVRQTAALIGGTAASLDAANPSFAGELGDGRIDIAASLLAAATRADVKASHSHIGGSCVAADR